VVEGSDHIRDVPALSAAGNIQAGCSPAAGSGQLQAGPRRLAPARGAAPEFPFARDYRPESADRFFWTICRIPVSPFVIIVKAGQLARLKTILGDYMPQYLVAGYLPDDFDQGTHRRFLDIGMR
jgi:hypothetical protein